MIMIFVLAKKKFGLCLLTTHVLPPFAQVTRIFESKTNMKAISMDEGEGAGVE